MTEPSVIDPIDDPNRPDATFTDRFVVATKDAVVVTYLPLIDDTATMSTKGGDADARQREKP